MKKVKKLLLRLLCIAVIVFLAVTFWPSIHSWFSGLLPVNRFHQASIRLTHTMESKGDLLVATYTDTGIAYAKKDAFLLGTVAEVNIPYQYEIHFGFPLSEVKLTATENGISVQIPPIRMLSDTLTVTGDVTKNDFWRLMDENSYQQIINNQAEACRNHYLNSSEYRLETQSAACKALSESLREWSGDHDLPLTFEHTENQ